MKNFQSLSLVVLQSSATLIIGANLDMKMQYCQIKMSGVLLEFIHTMPIILMPKFYKPDFLTTDAFYNNFPSLVFIVFVGRPSTFMKLLLDQDMGLVFGFLFINMGNISKKSTSLLLKNC